MELIYILTYDCNFRCSYCDISKRKQSIWSDVLTASLEFLKNNNLNIKKVKFFWGEPLLKKEEIKYLINNFPDKYNPNYYVVTNSTLIDEKFIDFVKEKEIKLTFSIDWNNKTNSENRLSFSWKDLSMTIIENTKKYNELVRVNQVITSKNSLDFMDNFIYIYNLWVREFNFLPEYYKEWTKKGLKDLKKWFDKILSFRNNWNNFKLINLDNYSESSFFNLWIIIDIDWKIYGTNLILSGIFEKYKEELIIWDVINWLTHDIENENFINKYNNKIKKIIEKEYSEKILKSVKYVDLILNNFCNEFKKTR